MEILLIPESRLGQHQAWDMISPLVVLIYRHGVVLKSGCSQTTTATTTSNKAIDLLKLGMALDTAERQGTGQADSGQVISRALGINNLKITPTMHPTTKANTLSNKPTNQSPF